MFSSLTTSGKDLETVGLLRVKPAVGSRGNREFLGKNLFSKIRRVLTPWKT